MTHGLGRMLGFVRFENDDIEIKNILYRMYFFRYNGLIYITQSYCLYFKYICVHICLYVLCYADDIKFK